MTAATLGKETTEEATEELALLVALDDGTDPALVRTMRDDGSPLLVAQGFRILPHLFDDYLRLAEQGLVHVSQTTHHHNGATVTTVYAFLSPEHAPARMRELRAAIKPKTRYPKPRPSRAKGTK